MLPKRASGLVALVAAEYPLLATHALIGCVQSAASGSQCGPGAMAAFLSKAVTLGLKTEGVTNRVVIGVVSAIGGGTASVIGGGKFANGALQAGFGYLFNQLSQAQELMNERIKSGAACPPSHAHMCAGLKAGTPEEVAKAEALQKGAALLADKASTGLAMAAAVPNPASPELAGAAIILKGFATLANPPTRAEIFYGSVTAFAPPTRFPYFDALVIYSLDLAKPALTQPKACPIPQKC